MSTFTLIFLVIVALSLLCAVLVIAATILSGQIGQNSSDIPQQETKAKQLIPKGLRVKDPQEC